MPPLAVWVLRLMLFLLPPVQNNVPRLREYVIVAIVTADAAQATPLPGRSSYETAATLTEIALLESGFVIRARGRDGEVGPWQLMPPAPARLREQAAEAIRRWRVQGAQGYTGERRCPCPLAVNRELGGAMLAAAFAP